MKRPNSFRFYLFAQRARMVSCGAAAVVIGILAIALQPCRAGDRGQGAVALIRTASRTPYARWIPTGSLNTERTDHAATLLQDGRVLVSGGLDRNFATTASAELYDSATRVWSQLGA
jgi:hypothetical protein